MRTIKLLGAYYDLYNEVFNLEHGQFVTPTGVYTGFYSGDCQLVRELTEHELVLLEKLDAIYWPMIDFSVALRGEQND